MGRESGFTGSKPRRRLVTACFTIRSSRQPRIPESCSGNQPEKPASSSGDALGNQATPEQQILARSQVDHCQAINHLPHSFGCVYPLPRVFLAAYSCIVDCLSNSGYLARITNLHPNPYPWGIAASNTPRTAQGNPHTHTYIYIHSNSYINAQPYSDNYAKSHSNRDTDIDSDR